MKYLKAIARWFYSYGYIIIAVAISAAVALIVISCVSSCGGRVQEAQCQDGGALCTLNQTLVCCPSWTTCGPNPATGCPANYCCPIPEGGSGWAAPQEYEVPGEERESSR